MYLPVVSWARRNKCYIDLTGTRQGASESWLLNWATGSPDVMMRDVSPGKSRLHLPLTDRWPVSSDDTWNVNVSEFWQTPFKLYVNGSTPDATAASFMTAPGPEKGGVWNERNCLNSPSLTAADNPYVVSAPTPGDSSNPHNFDGSFPMTLGIWYRMTDIEDWGYNTLYTNRYPIFTLWDEETLWKLQIDIAGQWGTPGFRAWDKHGNLTYDHQIGCANYWANHYDNNNWHQLVWVIGSNSVAFYFDAVRAVHLPLQSTDWPTGTPDFRIAINADSDPSIASGIKVDLAHATIHDDAITQDEINRWKIAVNRQYDFSIPDRIDPPTYAFGGIVPNPNGLWPTDPTPAEGEPQTFKDDSIWYTSGTPGEGRSPAPGQGIILPGETWFGAGNGGARVKFTGYENYRNVENAYRQSPKHSRNDNKHSIYTSLEPNYHRDADSGKAALILGRDSVENDVLLPMAEVNNAFTVMGIQVFRKVLTQAGGDANCVVRLYNHCENLVEQGTDDASGDPYVLEWTCVLDETGRTFEIADNGDGSGFRLTRANSEFAGNNDHMLSTKFCYLESGDAESTLATFPDTTTSDVNSYGRDFTRDKREIYGVTISTGTIKQVTGEGRSLHGGDITPTSMTLAVATPVQLPHDRLRKRPNIYQHTLRDAVGMTPPDNPTDLSLYGMMFVFPTELSVREMTEGQRLLKGQVPMRSRRPTRELFRWNNLTSPTRSIE